VSHCGGRLYGNCWRSGCSWVTVVAFVQKLLKEWMFVGHCG